MGDDGLPTTTRMCLGVDCDNAAATLQCPTCQKQGKDSYFCSQDCFKRSWASHKKEHKTQSTNPLRSLFPPNVVSEPDAAGHFNPFPTYPYTGPLRPVYPLSPRRQVTSKIKLPDYAGDGVPRSEQSLIGRRNIAILNEKEQEGMRKVCRLAREVLDIAAAAAKPGVTTDYIDEIVHKACLERDSYPSPLNYCKFPKSVCTSVNEVICHGIPDQYVLQDGDILNIDVTLYHGGFHGDLNETYYIGPKALADRDSIRVVECSRQCLDEAIKLVKPGMLFRDPGNVIEKHAKTLDCSVIKTYCGHGINQLFHCAPNIPHYAKNKAVGTAKAGMCFTIEPMIALGTWRDKTWPDDWTSVTQDGKRTAQFEHTLLVTEDGVEVLTARTADSPGGPVPIPVEETFGSITCPGQLFWREEHTLFCKYCNASSERSELANPSRVDSPIAHESVKMQHMHVEPLREEETGWLIFQAAGMNLEAGWLVDRVTGKRWETLDDARDKRLKGRIRMMEEKRWKGCLTGFERRLASASEVEDEPGEEAEAKPKPERDRMYRVGSQVFKQNDVDEIIEGLKMGIQIWKDKSEKKLSEEKEKDER